MQIQKNLVSVIVYISRYSESLVKTIESIEKSNYKKIELFLLFDNFRDLHFLASKKSLGNAMSFIMHKKDFVATRLNKMLDIISGEFVMFLTETSILYPDGIMNLVDGIKGCDGAIGKAETLQSYRSLLYPEKPPNFKNLFSLTDKPFCIPSAKLYKTEILRELRFNKDYEKMYHWDLDLRYVKNNKVAFVDRNILIDTYESLTVDAKERIEIVKPYNIERTKEEAKNIEIINKHLPEPTKKVLIYTAITDNYDKIHEHKLDDEKYRFICFTNNQKLSSDQYNIIIKDESLRTKNDKILFARKMKMQLHKFFYIYDFDYIVWIDGNMQFIRDISNLIDDLDHDHVAIFSHNERDCIYSEGEALIEMKKAPKTVIEKQLARYRDANIPIHNGLWATHCIIWKPTAEACEFFDIWYDEIETYSTRDQISLNYALKVTQVPFHTLNAIRYKSKEWELYIKKHQHHGN